MRGSPCSLWMMLRDRRQAVHGRHCAGKAPVGSLDLEAHEPHSPAPEHPETLLHVGCLLHADRATLLTDPACAFLGF